MPQYNRSARRLLWGLVSRLKSNKLICVSYTLFVLWMLAVITRQSEEESDSPIIEERLSNCNETQCFRKQYLQLKCKQRQEERRSMFLNQFPPNSGVRERLESRELLRLRNWLQRSQALVLEKEKAIYCFIPKVGCSSWKTKILESRGLINPRNHTGRDVLRPNEAIQDVLADYGIKMLSDYKPSTAYKLLNSYYKFMFVRDPFERLLSAYRDKIANPNNEHYKADREALLKRHKAPLDQNVPTFSQFLESLKKKPSRMYDVHWRPYDEICRPCVVKYDFIGRIETLDRDAQHVLSRLNLSGWFPIPRSARSSARLMRESYSRVPANVMQFVDILYKADTMYFGYKSLNERGYF